MVSKASAPKKKSRIASRTAPAETSPAPASANGTHSQRNQQTLVNIFADAFANVLSSERFPALLQEIKQALYSRDFGRAFGREDYLEAYAARWSPTRALCYASVFVGIDAHLEGLASDAAGSVESEASHDGAADSPDEARPRRGGLKMLCIGGCAAEHVAFASYLDQTKRSGTIALLDSAPWEHVASMLQMQLTTAPALSKYASAAARASNTALVDPSRLAFSFTQADVLSLTAEALLEQVGSAPLIVTLMFTLNELYTEGGIGKTTKFLRSLGQVLAGGSLLLVVDSPGSYSEAAVGKEKKRYPMQWLLNHTLLEGESSGYTWDKLESEESMWFRMPEGLSYPIQLENMRYQMHLYRISKKAS
ncbi:hypothetical protein MGU_02260 [Metarhizium guizhouense ARSEF 977]|uniref:25S rRNA (Uridine(2843)-N(3))-methyltransferase n=1 Tax=Metarhizium guizhouense (strain ARSEF 977) TaxID=1276136 RepID=A0A0B4H599_METGA|nr:hypothetical protein MGU_02260 [Metarhizium guizhouense ARSEF 977]